MSTFQNVALLGKGFLGSAILNELVTANFTVTVIGRSPSPKDPLPSGVKYATADYTSVASLASALAGNDVAISALKPSAKSSEPLIIHGSVSAGVKRYIPSDWGAFTTDPRVREDLGAALGPYFDVQDLLAEKARAGELEHTLFSVGAFTELVLQIPFIFDYASKHVDLWDAGRHPVSTTAVANIGKAVVAALQKPDATRNRNIRVHDLVVTQAQLAALAKKYSPPGTQWTETAVDAQARFAEARDAAERDPTSEFAILSAIKAAILSGRYKSGYDEVDNELLGLPTLTVEDLEAKFAAIYKEG